MPIIYVLLSALAVFFSGPFLFGRIFRGPVAHEALRGFARVFLLGLVFGMILPDAFRHAGWIVLPVFGVAVLLPLAWERWLYDKIHHISGAHDHDHHLSRWIVGLTVAGMGLHAFTDGLAIAAGGSASTGLALTMILHQLPFGLALWHIIHERFPGVEGFGLFTLNGLAMIGGYLVFIQIGDATGVLEIEFVQAFIGGFLLHILWHRGDWVRESAGHITQTSRQKSSRLRALGVLAGAVASGLSVIFYWMAN